ncbi:aminotransferase class V-fold PLP-dependent enzyme [Microbacterium oleivorans]|uniref:aminotransferase class V-fold PLP-dependent enzyme n=1 Tax=Microbacterium oleivorans TaxID=273677 RepID=UPI00203F98C8|nr:aminotransferase class V-fold PLP-dependent enzyme [Microbacterium oleivorans]MCM3696187.1 aminotransferase class V-fold PLP-dependent enzyme [Microbacterium oleivorans]
MSDLESYLAGFDVDTGYLNWASFGPLSVAVREEARADEELSATGRPSGIELVAGHVDEARALVAGALDAAVDDVTLVPSTTDALFHALFGLAGTVLLSPHEYPSIPVAARRAADARGQLTVRELDAGITRLTPEVVQDTLTDDVTAVAVSLVDYRTGYLVDLPALREVVGDRLLIVDAIQGFGVVDVDWAAADVVAGHGYKWLRAGRGTGFARFSPRARERIAPVLAGVAGTEAELGDLDVGPPKAGAAAYAVSRPDPQAAGRLRAALREMTDAGIPSIAALVAENARRVMAIADAHGIPVLTDRDRHAGIVTLAPDTGRAGLIAAELTNAGVTATVRGGVIRISPHAGTPDAAFELLDAAFAAARVGPILSTPTPAPLLPG